MQDRPETDCWSVMDPQVDDEGRHLALAIVKGEAVSVSDGSFDPKTKTGSSAFRLRGLTREHCFEGTNLVPGHPSEQSSYRSELAGIAGALSVVTAICKRHF